MTTADRQLAHPFDSDVAPPGARVKVPFFLADHATREISMNTQPLTDSQAAYQRMSNGLADAWRGNAAADPPHKPAERITLPDAIAMSLSPKDRSRVLPVIGQINASAGRERQWAIDGLRGFAHEIRGTAGGLVADSAVRAGDYVLALCDAAEGR